MILWPCLTEVVRAEAVFFTSRNAAVRACFIVLSVALASAAMVLRRRRRWVRPNLPGETRGVSSSKHQERHLNSTLYLLAQTKRKWREKGITFACIRRGHRKWAREWSWRGSSWGRSHWQRIQPEMRDQSRLYALLHIQSSGNSRQEPKVSASIWKNVTE